MTRDTYKREFGFESNLKTCRVAISQPCSAMERLLETTANFDHPVRAQSLKLLLNGGRCSLVPLATALRKHSRPNARSGRNNGNFESKGPRDCSNSAFRTSSVRTTTKRLGISRIGFGQKKALRGGLRRQKIDPQLRSRSTPAFILQPMRTSARRRIYRALPDIYQKRGTA